MNYELAKQLKDAGFPQDLRPGMRWTDDDPSTESVYVPTLSELIEACGDDFGSLSHMSGGWTAYLYNIEDSTRQLLESGETPEEAVAKLWLALHNG